MKKHYIETGRVWSACGRKFKKELTTWSEKEVTCKHCLKSLQPKKPVKCSIIFNGTDQKWEITCQDKTIDQLISHFLARLTDESLEKEIERRKKSK